jgi:hypothetical protein
MTTLEMNTAMNIPIQVHVDTVTAVALLFGVIDVARMAKDVEGIRIPAKEALDAHHPTQPELEGKKTR